MQENWFYLLIMTVLFIWCLPSASSHLKLWFWPFPDDKFPKRRFLTRRVRTAMQENWFYLLIMTVLFILAVWENWFYLLIMTVLFILLFISKRRFLTRRARAAMQENWFYLLIMTVLFILAYELKAKVKHFCHGKSRFRASGLRSSQKLLS